MTQFDKNLVELAETYYREAIGWAEENGSSQSVVKLAAESNMSVEELSGLNLAHTITKLLNLCNLDNYDDELSDDTRAALAQIEKKVKLLKRQEPEISATD